MTDWSLAALMFIVRWTVWDLLHPLSSELENLRIWVKRQVAILQSQAVVPTGTSQAANTQQVNFSTLNGTSGSFVGRSDAVASLENAHLLYRALGGETLSRVVFSGDVAPDTVSPQIEIQVTTFVRGSAAGFSTPVILTITNPGTNPVDTSPNIRLHAGDCVVAATTSAWSGVRVDGTLVITKS